MGVPQGAVILHEPFRSISISELRQLDQFLCGIERLRKGLLVSCQAKHSIKAGLLTPKW